MQEIRYQIVFTIILTLFKSILLQGQEADTLPPADTIYSQSETPAIPASDSAPLPVDSVIARSDTLAPVPDTLPSRSDTLVNDTLAESEGMGSDITSEVDYNAEDSIVFDMKNGAVELYGNAVITYGEIKLESDYIRYEMGNNIVTAKGLPDSTGEVSGKPLFSEADENFEATNLRYNFKTQKGFIEEVITEQEGGYLHAEKTKKQRTGHIHLKDGKYTTCDAEHPHFYVAITKGVNMPGDKIVSGPAYLVVEDVPLPIGIPFGFFPNSRTKTSGVLIPQYGEEERRGFYLRDGGYYFAMNDYMDLRITGDIYTNGTWGVRVGSNYKLRYKFNGNLRVQYFKNVSGYKNIEGLYSVSRDYSINWSHAQAREANPTSNFRANVNLSSSSYDRNHTRNINNVVNNTKQSSISYTKSWPNSPFNFSASLNHSQNSRSGSVNMTLPKMSFNMSRINPFERKQRTGPKKWYENIQLSYSSLLENRIRTTDSLLFTNQVWSDMNNGFRHEIPVSFNIKPFRNVAALQSMTITPNLSYKGMLYSSYTEKRITGYESYEEDGTTVYDPIVEDTTYQGKFTYAHSYLPRISAGISPKVYGMYQFTSEDSRIVAIRHMMTPSASFSYTPDVNRFQPNYYRDLYDTVNNELLETYSIYTNSLYGTPTFNGANGSISLSLRNNLEAKLRPKNDTVDKLEKIKLLDNFNFSTGYNLFNRDSLAPSWSPVNFNGNTRLFNNRLNLNFRGTMDPFGYDSLRTRTRETYFSQTGKLVRLTNASVSMGVSFQSQQGKEEEGDQAEADREESQLNNPDMQGIGSEYDPAADDYYGGYVDFDVPWSLRLDYSFSYSKRTDEARIVQTIRASGDLSLTPNWKIGFNTGYDLYNKKVSTTNISIYRDLHCWEMRLSVVPFGNYKSYNFQINAKSSILSDLKYNKRKSWTDNF